MRTRFQGAKFGTTHLVAAILVLALGSPIFVQAQAPSEYQVKAAFLFNFAKFIEWPAAAFRNGQSPLTICLLGEDPFGKVLDETVKGQAVGGRAFAVRRVVQISRDDGCQIAFLSGLEKSRAEQTLAALKGLPILTVSDGEEIGDAGSIIAFLIQDNKIRFNINLESAERAGIKISSQLLKLAKTVYERRKN